MPARVPPGWRKGPARQAAIACDLDGGKCTELLAESVEALGGHGGAALAVDGEGRLETVVGHWPDGGPPGPSALQQAAAAALVQGGPCVSTLAPAEQLRGGAGKGNGYYAAPLVLGDDVVGVLVVTGLDRHGLSPTRSTARLGRLAEILTIALDRLTTLGALQERDAELVALSHQLGAYADDFRATYEAERARAKQLGKALGQLALTYRATVSALAKAVEAKDERTPGHLQRVTRYGIMLTALVAPEHTGDPQFEYGFLLHDVGKLALPDHVLTKKGPLTETDWAVVKSHPATGMHILEEAGFLEGAKKIVHSHHEHWDGSGYPRGLRGSEIPVGARIFAVCDAFDAMTSDRPHRPSLGFEEALGALHAASGSQLWPTAVEAFLSLSRDQLEDALHGRPDCNRAKPGAWAGQSWA